MALDEVKVLVVDDSIVYRRILSDTVAQIPGAAVVGTAANGKLALAKLETQPVDLILLDVEMPVLGGPETLEALRKLHPGIGVIIVSGINPSAADITIMMLNKGALGFVPKPEGANAQESFQELLGQLAPLVQLFITRRYLGQATQAKPTDARTAPARTVAPAPPVAAPEASRPAPPAAPPGGSPKHVNVVAVAVSTGGPQALAEVIPQLPAGLGVPFLLVQHMPPVFTKSLADSLAKRSKVAVREAVDGEAVLPETVYIAPGGHHMLVRGKARQDASRCIGLSDAPPENGCRPAADVLFNSVAASYGGNILAVVMTGMGRDGCAGVKAMKQYPCHCITQSEDSCVVYGMPAAVDQAGLSNERVHVSAIADRIAAFVRRHPPT